MIKDLIFSAVSCLSVVALVFWNDKMAVFAAAIILLITSFIQIMSTVRSRTVKVFGKERRGVVIEKSEVSRVHQHGQPAGNTNITFSGDVRQFNKYSTRANVGVLYIKGEDGRIFHTRELNKEQTDFFEVGDSIIIYAGAKFPIVLNEPEARQKWLCPICGTVLPDGVDCSGCGLEFN